MKFNRILVLVGLLLAIPNGSFAQSSTPTSVIETFHGVLLDVMKSAKSLSTSQRYQKLEPAIVSSFDLRFMTRVASGSAWRKAAVENQRELVEAFKRMSVATYAFRFSGYSGQRFETLKESAGPRNSRLVHTQIVSPPNNKDARPQITKLTYVTKQIAENWKIVDILLDGGISEIAVKYSEYRNLLKTGGASALAQRLNKKADQLLAK